MADNQQYNRLQKLSGSNYEIVDGEPDIRDWDVKDGSGRKLGEVEDLLFDEQSRKVRYLVVELEDDDSDLDDKEVLVPIGLAELHESDDDVILRGVTREQLQSLPEYDEDRFDNDYENNIRNVFAGTGGAGLAGGATRSDDFYEHEHFNDQNLYRNRQNPESSNTENTIPVINEQLQVGKREVETGGIRLRSKVVENEVEENVRLRDETVRVEREDVNRPARDGELREQEVEMHEYDEVPVVNKEARVVEEIKLSKDVTDRDETIRDTVRNTEVDIERDDDNTPRNNETPTR